MCLPEYAQETTCLDVTEQKANAGILIDKLKFTNL